MVKAVGRDKVVFASAHEVEGVAVEGVKMGVSACARIFLNY